MRRLRECLLLVVAGLCGSTSRAAEIVGKVETVNGQSFSISSTSGGLPRPGDSVVVYFEFPGEGPVQVARGIVIGVADGRITAKVARLVGTLAKGQLVRIEPQPAPQPGRAVGTGSQGNLPPTRRIDSARDAVDLPPENIADRLPSRASNDDVPDPPTAETSTTTNDTAVVIAQDYEGKLFNGTRPIADLTLRVDHGSHAVEAVSVNGQTFDRFNGLRATVAGGPLIIRSFPSIRSLSPPSDGRPSRVESGLPDSEREVTLVFDANAGPANQARRLSGVIKTDTGQTLRFAVSSSVGLLPFSGAAHPVVVPSPDQLPPDFSPETRKALSEGGGMLRRSPPR